MEQFFLDDIDKILENLVQLNILANEQDNCIPYRSVYTINGNPILPPLMTPERRVEMQSLRRAAIEIEQAKQTNVLKDKENVNNVISGDHGKLTYRVSRARSKPKLQISQTLIYDNTRNAILKYSDPSKLETQLAGDNKDPKFLNFLLAVLECKELAIRALPNVLDTVSNDGFSTEEEMNPNFTDCSQSMPIVKEAQLMAAFEDHNQVDLRRSSTMPSIYSTSVSDDEKSDTNWNQPPSDDEKSVTKWGEKDTSCKSTRSYTKESLPMDIKSETTAPPSVSKKEEKVSKNAPQKLLNDRRTKCSQRTPSVVSHAAHATSHGNTEKSGNNAEGNKISSTQRRLNYKPHATLKRAETLKKSSTSCNNGNSKTNSKVVPQDAPLAAPQSAPQAAPPTDQLKLKQIDELEQQQRERLQQLMLQQANEQQYLQQQFRMELQQLLCPLYLDVNSLKGEESYDGQS